MASNRERISAGPSCEMEELSTTTLGFCAPLHRPASSNNTCFKSSVVETIVNTMSQAASAAFDGETLAPYSTNGAAYDAVRFQTLTACPAFNSRLTIALPMRPKPIQPNVFAIDLASRFLLPSM